MPVDVYPIDSMNCLSRPMEHTLGIGEKHDPQFTLSKAHHHAVAIVPKTEEQPVDNAVEQLSIFSSEELLVSPSPSPASEKAWMTRVATSPSRISQFWTSTAPSGASGRTSPASCRVEADGTLVPFSEGWGSSGMGSPTECWTHSSSEFPNDAVVCSLSAVLEAGNVLRRFYLTSKACSGILRRAEKRGKELPLALQKALEAVAGASTAKTCAP